MRVKPLFPDETHYLGGNQEPEKQRHFGNAAGDVIEFEVKTPYGEPECPALWVWWKRPGNFWALCDDSPGNLNDEKFDCEFLYRLAPMVDAVVRKGLDVSAVLDWVREWVDANGEPGWDNRRPAFPIYKFMGWESELPTYNQKKASV